MGRYELLIFDVDDTLAVGRDSEALLPGRREFFAGLAAAEGGGPEVALCSNQGGVACRLAGWGEKYPTQAQAEAHVYEVARKVGEVYRQPAVYIAFNYQTREGTWLQAEGDDPRWRRDWRKPGPGMLLQAMKEASIPPDRTLMVGDRDDDRLAAAAAGCDFQWADEFFEEAG